MTLIQHEGTLALKFGFKFSNMVKFSSSLIDWSVRDLLTSNSGLSMGTKG
jgi:hypothetical protein